MRIALVSTIEEAVPPPKYGGVEVVVFNLAQELTNMGHEVFLLASGDSKSKATLIPLVPQAIRRLPEATDYKVREAYKYMAISQTIRELKKLKVDVIHNHTNWHFIPFADHTGIPTLTTLHGPLDIPHEKLVYGTFPQHPYVSISNNQREPFPTLNFVETIYNGIDLNQYTFAPEPGSYLVFLGRMSPEKGPKIAIEVAKASGLPLKMAAKIDAVDREYFAKEIKPLIDDKQIQYIGEVGGTEKDALLGKALALLTPIQWREPFGLVMAEAMACGTPAIGFAMGSVPEVIEDSISGYVVKTADEMVQRVGQIKNISRAVCRERAETRFASPIMAQNYLRAYEKVISA